MAVRVPLYNNSGDLQEMTSTMVDNIKDQIVYQYSINPSVVLSVVSSGGNLGSLTDTRLQAGAHSTDASAFPNESTTAEPSVVSVVYDKIEQTIQSTSGTADTGKTFPIYRTATGDIQAMSLTDMKDTFFHPAIDLLVSGSLTTQQGGTYHINTSTTVTGSVEVSGVGTAVFTDTGANTSSYTAAQIGVQDLDNPTTLTNYYLHRLNGNDTAITLPMFIRNDDDLQVYPEATFKSLVQGWIRQTAANSTDGFKLRYDFITGTNRGSGMVDQRLNGSGDYQTFQVDGDDYRAQEFPDGTLTTINTYFLKINKS